MVSGFSLFRKHLTIALWSLSGHLFMPNRLFLIDSNPIILIRQGVTLGGTGKEQGKRHPTLKDNVMVSAGAKILGSFTIGENSKIGAGAVVLEEVPPNCTVVGVPGRVVRMGNKKVPRSDMDQIHLPDPVLNDIHSLQADNEKMHSQLIEMLKKMKCMEEDGYECGQEKTTKIKIEEKREEI